MKTQSIDTHIEAEQFQVSLLRQKSIADKFYQIRSLSKSTIQLSKRAIFRANKGLNEQQVNLLFINLHYGPDLANRVKLYMNQKYGDS
jgi:hypothetical protein